MRAIDILKVILVTPRVPCGGWLCVWTEEAFQAISRRYEFRVVNKTIAYGGGTYFPVIIQEISNIPLFIVFEILFGLFEVFCLFFDRSAAFGHTTASTYVLDASRVCSFGMEIRGIPRFPSPCAVIRVPINL